MLSHKISRPKDQNRDQADERRRNVESFGNHCLCHYRDHRTRREYAQAGAGVSAEPRRKFPAPNLPQKRVLLTCHGRFPIRKRAKVRLLEAPRV